MFADSPTAARETMPPDADLARDESRARKWLFAALAVGLLLRLHCLIFPYLWLDEYVTLWSIGGATYAEMLDRSLHWTASAPLFVMSYRLTCDLVGDAELGVKLPGVVGGVLTIWAAWWTARRLFQRTDVAVVAAWFVALAPQFVHFSQEARPYSLGALQVLLATGFLAEWLRTGRKRDIAGAAIFSVTAVGFHLLSALAIVAHNLVVLAWGVQARWIWRRWAVWFAAQAVVAIGLYFVGAQFLLLSTRHSSMILETALPMATRKALDEDWRGALTSELGFFVIAAAVAAIARLFRGTEIGRAWSEQRLALVVAAAAYAVPTTLLSVLCGLRVLDCWPRYYFLFQAGFLICLAWLAVRAFPRAVSRVVVAIIVLGLLSHINFVGGVPSCRLTEDWLSFPAVQAKLRTLGSDELVLSRAGLIEANHADFLSSELGVSYLKCFCEAKDGPLHAEHVALPFSPESESSREYLDALVRERLLGRPDFWLVNMGPQDFDYRGWLMKQLGDRFDSREESRTPFLIISRFVRRQDAALVLAEKKGTSD